MCSLDVNTFMPRSGHCEMADVGIQKINSNPCGVRFLNNETGVLKPLKLQAPLVPRTAPQRRLLTARLFTQRTYDAHPVFEGYQIDSLTVCTHLPFTTQIPILHINSATRKCIKDYCQPQHSFPCPLENETDKRLQENLLQISN